MGLDAAATSARRVAPTSSPMCAGGGTAASRRPRRRARLRHRSEQYLASRRRAVNTAAQDSQTRRIAAPCPPEDLATAPLLVLPDQLRARDPVALHSASIGESRRWASRARSARLAA